MATKTIEKELLELENKYWQTIKDHDVESALSMTDFPCTIAGAGGAGSFDRDMYRQAMQSGEYVIHGFHIADDVTVRLITEDVAVLAYKVQEDLTVDNAPVSFEAADASVWVRKGGKWLCSMHTESLLGDSYGRDRQKTS